MTSALRGRGGLPVGQTVTTVLIGGMNMTVTGGVKEFCGRHIFEILVLL